MSSRSGITVSQDCITAFNDLKLAKKYKWIILKVSDDELNIEVDKTASPNDLPEDPEAQWDAFSETILAAKSRDLLKRGKPGVEPVFAKEEGQGARYAVYDFEYKLKNGEGTRNKIVFISWNPMNASRRSKMMLTSSKTTIRSALSGVAVDLQISDTWMSYKEALGEASNNQAEGCE